MDTVIICHGVTHGGRFGLDPLQSDGAALPRMQGVARNKRVRKAKRMVMTAA